MANPYHVKICPRAKENIQALPSKQRKQLLKIAEALGINPRPAGTQKIEGMTGLYSENIGNLRLIYKIEDQEVLILLIK